MDSTGLDVTKNPQLVLCSIGIVLDGTGWIDRDDDKINNPYAYDVQKDGTG